MNRKSKATEDIDSQENSSATSEEPQSKSFMVGGGTRTVALNIADITLKSKEHYKKQTYCVICLRNFTNFFRQHHCRVCANAVCADCSRSHINKQRACDLCVARCANPQEQKKQAEIITTLETLCAYLVYRRNLKMAELQTLKSAPSQASTGLLKELDAQERNISQLYRQNEDLKAEREALEAELEKVREGNAQIQEAISQIEREIGHEVDSYS